MITSPDTASNSNPAYVARQSIVSADRDTVGYELLFRDGSVNAYPDICPDEATSRLISDAQSDLDIENLVGDHRAFINFPEQSLLNGSPRLFNKDKIVVEILESVTPSEAVLAACKALKEQGYLLALDDYDFHVKWRALHELVDIIKVDIESVDGVTLSAGVASLRGKGVSLIAERVETPEQFELCKRLGFDYFQGFLFSKPEVFETRAASNL